MKRWWLVIALLLSVGVNLGILATLLVQRGRAVEAPPDGAPPEEASGRMPPILGHLADELELREEQRQRFFTVQRAFFEAVGDARSRVGRAQAELRLELFSPEPDRATIERLLGEIGRGHVDLERALVENLLRSRELLDPEQQQRYLQLLARWRRGRAEMERFGPPGRRPPWGGERRGRGEWRRDGEPPAGDPRNADPPI